MEYDEKKQRDYIRTGILALTRWLKSADPIIQVPQSDLSSILYRYLFRLSAIFKQSGFEEEVEWRLIKPMDNIGKPHDVCFRQGERGLTQYMEFEFREIFKDPSAILKEICIGPRCPVETKIVLDNFLTKNNYHTIENGELKVKADKKICRSDISFR